MNDDSGSLRQQWSILINSFIEEDSEEKLLKLKSLNLSFDEIQDYSKELSQQRKFLNQKIEHIKEQIDEKYAIIETLQLVKSDISEVVKEIEDLNRQGEVLSQEMVKMERKSKSLRRAEQILFSEDQSA